MERERYGWDLEGVNKEELEGTPRKREEVTCWGGKKKECTKKMVRGEGCTR